MSCYKIPSTKNGFENKEYNTTQEEDNNPNFEHDDIKFFFHKTNNMNNHDR